MKMKSVLLLFVAACSFRIASAAPFGLVMGMSPEQAGAKPEDIKKTDPSTYIVLSNQLPKPNPSFEVVALRFTKDKGLAVIDAYTPDIGCNDRGDQIKDAFQRMGESLLRAYGPGCKRYDYIKQDSVFQEPRYWLLALKKQEAVLVAFWDAEEGFKPRGDVRNVSLEATVRDGEPFLHVHYELLNSASYFEEKKAREAENL